MKPGFFLPNMRYLFFNKILSIALIGLRLYKQRHSSINLGDMKEDLLLLNEHNLPERILNRKRSYISLRYWIGWAGGYTDSKKEEDNER